MQEDTLIDDYLKWRESTIKNLASCRGAAGRLILKGVSCGNSRTSPLGVALDSRVFYVELRALSESKWSKKMVTKFMEYERKAVAVLSESGCGREELSEAVLEGRLTSAEAAQYARVKIHTSIQQL